MGTFSFDESEFGGSNEQEDAADQALESLEETPVEDSQIEEDPELADVDTRLETADYYRAILKHEFFDTESPAAQIVDREIRAFIRERLEILLGLRAPSAVKVEMPEPQFDDDEVTALKLLASKVMKKPALVADAAPKVKKMEAPAPAPKPEIKKAKPQLKKVAPPAPPPSTKPKAKPALKKAAPAVTEKKSPPKPKADAEMQVIRKADGSEETLIEGDIIEEGNRKYRVVRNEKGTLFKKDVTGQVVPPGVSAHMTPQQFSLLSQRLAEESISRLDDTTGLAIVASLQKKE